MQPQLSPTRNPSSVPVRHGQAPWIESDLLRLDPDGPLDHLLQGFESAYRHKRPEQEIIIGNRQTTVKELMAEEREQKIANLRETIRRAHANEAARREHAHQKVKTEADDSAGRPRAELIAALSTYESWTAQYREAEKVLTEARQTKADLSTSEAPIAALKKSLVDAEAGVQAGEIKFEQIKSQGRELARALSAALAPAQREFGYRLAKERGARLGANLATLQSLRFDPAALQRAEIYGLEKLAGCFQNVTRLEQIDYRPYNAHPSIQAHELLEAFERLKVELSESTK
jgi:hypothetical protein